MTTILKKTVDSIYSFLLADSGEDLSNSFVKRALFVFLVLAMFSSAAYAMIFIQA